MLRFEPRAVSAKRDSGPRSWTLSSVSLSRGPSKRDITGIQYLVCTLTPQGEKAMRFGCTGIVGPMSAAMTPAS